MDNTRKGLAAIGMATRDVALPGATGRDLAPQLLQFQQTKPQRPADVPGSIRTGVTTGGLQLNRGGAINVGPRDTAPPGATGRDAARQETRFQQMNPNPPGPDPAGWNPLAPPLTTRQLAAVRLVMQGMTCAQVAGELGTIRQTVHRWKQLPAFIAELRRLHELAAIGQAVEARKIRRVQ